jgi:caffeoyl-CoA O-methyltransferase
MDIVNPALDEYLISHSTAADDVLRELAAETHAALPGQAGMQISHDEGALLTLLVNLVHAEFAVEVGTFTGYSSICIARGLAPGGRLLACDVNDEWTSVARRYWDRAEVSSMVDLRLGPAAQTLRSLPPGPSVDFAFIDADKENYPVYYEELASRLRPGGLVVLDNVLRGGRVVDPSAQNPADIAIRAVNDAIVTDERVDVVMLPVRDGVTIARRRT